ncbi:MAG: 4Fe-4S dicluster domain-containing protein [Promethearchaeota archaeon]
MLKRSKGLKSRYIDQSKFNISLFKGELEDKAKIIIPKMFNSIQKAKSIYKKEIKELPDELHLIPEGFWEEVIDKAKSLGIDLIGFAPIDENLIFEKDYTSSIEVLYENGIILGMEMNYEDIDAAPEPPAGLESLNIYSELGIATNLLAEFIRSKGVKAIACHPLGGPILYPAMAVKAGLGKIGSQGLLITKQFGPRQRLSMITVNASPLPEIPELNFDVEGYCKKCKRCIRHCPVNAIYDEPIVKENGIISRIDGEKCIEYFYETTGCSVCIKECPFHKLGYKAAYYARL